MGYKLSTYDLKEGTAAYHGQPYPIPRLHIDIFKKKIDSQESIGVLKKTIHGFASKIIPNWETVCGEYTYLQPPMGILLFMYFWGKNVWSHAAPRICTGNLDDILVWTKGNLTHNLCDFDLLLEQIWSSMMQSLCFLLIVSNNQGVRIVDKVYQLYLY